MIVIKMRLFEVVLVDVVGCGVSWLVCDVVCGIFV